jgi:uncharacterized membrane protein
MANPKRFFSEEEQDEILDAISEAELITSGEIRVHLDLRAGDDTLGRAQDVFEELGMANTIQRNGVLLYLAVEEGKFVVLGDSGITDRVPEDFWDNIRDGVEESFHRGDFLDGVLYFIEEAGENLQEYFPHDAEGLNELPDAISFGQADEGDEVVESQEIEIELPEVTFDEEDAFKPTEFAEELE